MMIILIIVIQKLMTMLKLLVGIVNLNYTKHLGNIDEELLPAALHPKRVRNWCMSKYGKKEIGSIFSQFEFDHCK